MIEVRWHGCGGKGYERQSFMRYPEHN